MNAMRGLFLLLGLLGLSSSLLLTPLSYDPVSFTEKMELYLKSLMLITLGLSMNGTYFAESMAKYGVSAIESMISIWMLYLPLSAALSILCVNLKSVAGEHERWKYGVNIADSIENPCRKRNKSDYGGRFCKAI